MKTLDESVKYLQKHLGTKTVLYLAGLEKEQAKMLNSGSSSFQQEVEMRICHAYEALLPIIEVYDSKTAVAWLFGLNTRLDEAPAYVLRHANKAEDLSDLVKIAKEFASK